jgi:hypothetical protein
VRSSPSLRARATTLAIRLKRDKLPIEHPKRAIAMAFDEASS